MISFVVGKASIKEDLYLSDIWVYDLKEYRKIRLTRSGKDSRPRWSPDSKAIAFVSKRGVKEKEKARGVWLIEVEGGEAYPLFKMDWGIEDLQWSSTGREIVFVAPLQKEEDVKEVGRIPLWFNGKGFVYTRQTHAFLYDLREGTYRQVTEGILEVVQAEISPDGKKLAYIASTEEVRPYIQDLFIVDLEGGEVRRLTSGDMHIAEICWSPDSRSIAMRAHRLERGFATNYRLILLELNEGFSEPLKDFPYNIDNALNSDVRLYPIKRRLRWGRDGIYFIAQRKGSAVLLKYDGEVKEVIVGNLSIESFSVREGKLAFTSMNSHSLPELFYKDGDKILKLTNFHDDSKVEDIRAPKRFTFSASDGREIESWLLEGGERLLLYIHGGPKTAFGNAYMHELQCFASAGFSVLLVNPRGSDGYGEEFADIRGSYGRRDFMDLMEAVDEVVKRFKMDAENMAVAGGSYGGFMTNWIIGKTDRFKAAVTDRSICNWISFFNTSDIGFYFAKDQLQADPWTGFEKLWKYSPIAYVDKVNTPLLIIHSMEDYRCWLDQAIEFFTALRYHGKEVKLVLFPDEDHDLSRSGKPSHRVKRIKLYIEWVKGR